MGFTNAESKKPRRLQKNARKEIEKIQLLNKEIKELKAENKRLKGQVRNLTNQVEKLKLNRPVIISQKRAKKLAEEKDPTLKCPKCSKTLKIMLIKRPDFTMKISSCKACKYKHSQKL